MLANIQISCHQVLGVSYRADMAAIRRAMRARALLYRPDKAGQPEQMVLVNEAYATATQAALQAPQRTRWGPARHIALKPSKRLTMPGRPATCLGERSRSSNTPFRASKQPSAAYCKGLLVITEAVF